MTALDADAPTWSLIPGQAPGTASLTGEIDFSVTPQVRERLLAFIKTGAPEIVLDLSGLSYIDSSGLALFIEAHKLLAEEGRRMRIAAISPQVQKLFALTQIGGLFGLPD